MVRPRVVVGVGHHPLHVDGLDLDVVLERLRDLLLDEWRRFVPDGVPRPELDHDGRDAFVAGGAYPASNYEQTIQRTITEAIELTLEIDLGLSPSAYESELISLVQSVA